MLAPNLRQHHGDGLGILVPEVRGKDGLVYVAKLVPLSDISAFGTN